MANFTTIRVPGQNSIVADTTDDTLDLVPGPGITISTNAGADSITIGATSTTGYTGSHGEIGYTGSQGIQGNQGYTGSVVQSYRTFRVSGQASLVADQLDDIIDLVAGPGITITTNASIDAITISATGGVGGPGYSGSVGAMGPEGFTGSRGYAGSSSTSYKTIRVPGQSSLIADQYDDVLDLVAGPGIEITTNASIDAITISSIGGTGDTGYTGSVGNTGSPGFTGSHGYSGSASLSYRIIRVAGQTNLVADQHDDVLDIVAGPGISITTNAQIDAITITATGGGTGGGLGFTGSIGGLGFTGSMGLGALGYTGSAGLGSLGYTGSVGLGSLGYTGSMGTTGNLGYTGSAGSAASANTALIVACSDETSPLTAGTAKSTFRMPYAFNLTGVRASLTTAQASGSIFTVDINQSGTSILSTKITIDNGEKSSATAVVPAVISTAALTDDSEITIDIDQVGSGTAAGLKVTLIGNLP